MAFKNSNNVMRFNNSRRTNDRDDSWKADAFLNLYLPKRDGSKAKLISVPLKLDRVNDAELIEFLSAHEDNAQKLISKRVIADFRLADGSNSSGLDLDLDDEQDSFGAEAHG